MSRFRAVVVGLAFAAGVATTACSGSNPGLAGGGDDSGERDGGSTADSATADSSTPDSGTVDTGTLDSTTADSGADTSMPESGMDSAPGDSGGVCIPGMSMSVPCGNCGNAMMTCVGSGTWQTGPCHNQGECAPGAVAACNSYGTQTCSVGCTWGACSCATAPQCTPGDTCTSGCSAITCDGCGQWPGTCGAPCSGMTTFLYTGAAQSFVVPPSVTSVTITAYGAQGGADCYMDPGGEGASVTATLSVTPGETLAIYVGGAGGLATQNGTGYCVNGGTAGFNGGAVGGGAMDYAGGGGGGASDVRRGGVGLGNRVVVAGGGGGGGAGPSGGAGGGGGNPTGGAGGTSSASGGGGGTSSAGGAGASGAMSGTAGTGGAGGAGDYCGGGAGGGGYYGGGGGGGTGTTTGGGGGGGGSSFATPTATGVSMQSGVQPGDGEIIVSY